MAKPYPIVPLSVVDRLNDLNNALEVYNKLVMAWTQQCLDGDVDGDPRRFTAGLTFLFRPIIEGFQDIESQVDQMRKLGLVGIATLDDTDPNNGNA